MTRKELRPVIENAKLNDNMSVAEKFQNSVLRPVIKMQHQIIIALFTNHLKKSGFNIDSLEPKKKNAFLKEAVSKNQHLKNQYIGLIIGMFTDGEFERYLSDQTEYGRRIIQMIAQRLQDTYK